MRARSSRLGRILAVTAAVFIWTVGPWFPAVVCAYETLSQDVGAAAVASAPECDRCHQPQSKESRPAHDCCKRILDNCCLSAPGTSGTPSASVHLEAPVMTPAPILLTHVSPRAVELPLIARVFAPPNVLASPVLRL